jgi:hypothetical protein
MSSYGNLIFISPNIIIMAIEYNCEEIMTKNPISNQELLFTKILNLA